MENYILAKDITLLFVEADSFPQGIATAHEKLRGLLPDWKQRQFFGLSQPDQKGVIEYKAGVEEKFPGEAKALNCETLILKKGNYISGLVKDFTKNPKSIGEFFQTLIHQPGIDPQGYCVEMYLGEEDVRCMVRML